jgi:phospholipid/cholesterol/gamma-HCH transport system substrate-binding protein
MIDRINRGQGILGALMNPQTNGQRLAANITGAAESIRKASTRLDETSTKLNDLSARLDRANGLLPQLIEDQRYADQVMSDLRRSTVDMREVLDKINSRQGTLGLLINDPALYNGASDLVSTNGWGVSLLKDLYRVSHPFSTTAPTSGPQVPAEPASYPPAVNNTLSPAMAQPVEEQK